MRASRIEGAAPSVRIATAEMAPASLAPYPTYLAGSTSIVSGWAQRVCSCV